MGTLLYIFFRLLENPAKVGFWIAARCLRGHHDSSQDIKYSPTNLRLPKVLLTVDEKT
ncbi:MAG: hypothetical protein H7318_13630 [Oligoflexus sp.]|nr:hypothetical protein [Oligoflexus sp.]